jgi:hypothetical protein
MRPKFPKDRIVVIDWLQFADHPDKLGEIDGAQITLSYISKLEAKCERYRKALETIEKISGGFYPPASGWKEDLINQCNYYAKKALGEKSEQ